MNCEVAPRKCMQKYTVVAHFLAGSVVNCEGAQKKTHAKEYIFCAFFDQVLARYLPYFPPPAPPIKLAGSVAVQSCRDLIIV